MSRSSWNISLMLNLVNLTKTLSSTFPSILFDCRLCRIIAVLPATSVDCERGFSSLSRIKNDIRSSLKTPHLGCLIRISTMEMDALTLEQDHSERLIADWKNSKDRRSSGKGDRILSES